MANPESAGEVCSKPLHLIFQSDFPSVAMTRSGLSLEELRIVEGQGQNSEVTTPPEEISRMNELGKQEICGGSGELLGNPWHFQSVIERSSECPFRISWLGRGVTSGLDRRDPQLSHLKNHAEKLPRYLDLLVISKLFGCKRKKKVWWDWTIYWRTILRKERRKKNYLMWDFFSP